MLERLEYFLINSMNATSICDKLVAYKTNNLNEDNTQDLFILDLVNNVAYQIYNINTIDFDYSICLSIDLILMQCEKRNFNYKETTISKAIMSSYANRLIA